jgi:hypothetical protein
VGVMREIPGHSKFENFSRAEWLTISPRDYDELDRIYWNLHDKLPKIETSPDWPELRKHIFMMHNLGAIFWTSANFRKIMPTGTTLEFIFTGDLLHDNNRIIGLNLKDLLLGDKFSHDTIEKMFKHFPQEYLHDIESIAGTKALPDENGSLLPYWFKLADTCGKIPTRDTRSLFELDGQYDQWLQRQILAGRFPLSNGMSAEEYRVADLAYTTRAQAIITKIVPEIDFNLALREAAEMTMGR